VKIKEDETLAARNILTGQVAKEKGFALAGFSEDCYVLAPFCIRQVRPRSLHLAVYHPGSQVEMRARFVIASVRNKQTVPAARHKIFDPVNHW
jgi:hypothetical protein